jgi:hypothetical protein
MNARFLLPVLPIAGFRLACEPWSTNRRFTARLGMMRVMFKGFGEVLTPVTKQKELVCYLSLIDLAIP